MRILVIDDSDVARPLMAVLLRRSGHIVVDLPTPIGAPRTILREGINVVVLDVNLPSMRGDLVAAMIRRNARLSQVELVLVSGVESERLEALAEAAGADAHVQKQPIDDKLACAVMHAFNELR